MAPCSFMFPDLSGSPLLSLSHWAREIRHLQQFFLSSGGVQLCHRTLSGFLGAAISIKEFLLQEEFMHCSFLPRAQTYFLVFLTWKAGDGAAAAEASPVDLGCDPQVLCS